MFSRGARYEARIENLEGMMRFVLGCVGELPWAVGRVSNIELVVEEAVVNVCKYAYPEGDGEVEIRCEGDERALHILVADSGIPFNVLAAAEPDLCADILERQVGGLGCFLIRSMSDRSEYRREGGRNLLQLTFLSAGKPGGESGDP